MLQLRLYDLTQQAGVNSIPTLVVDGQFSVGGTSGAEEILETLKAAVKEFKGGRMFAVKENELD